MRLAEQFVGQEMLAHRASSFTSRQLFYWARDIEGSSAEVDYLYDRQDQIVPIEVKSGSSGKLKSLHSFLRGTVLTGVCLQQIDDAHQSGAIQFWPLYTQF